MIGCRQGQDIKILGKHPAMIPSCVLSMFLKSRNFIGHSTLSFGIMNGMIMAVVVNKYYNIYTIQIKTIDHG